MEQLTAETPLAKKSAVALGFFDGVHRGHRGVLHAAAVSAQRSGLVPCAFTFAAASVPAKQNQPLEYLYTDAQKCMLLEKCGITAIYSPAFQELKALDGESFCRRILKEHLMAEEVFCGGDFRFGAKAAWDFDALCAFGVAMGFRVHRVEPVRCGGEKISSTMIRHALRTGKPEEAASLLGAPYQICGQVEHGAALGRTKAVPTINIPFADGQLVPRYGVYVSRTHTPEGIWDSITDVGVKPTVSTEHHPIAETFLLDFSGNLYETPCMVELLHFLRPERQFSDVDALYRQIARDQENCRAWLQSNVGGVS